MISPSDMVSMMNEDVNEPDMFIDAVAGVNEPLTTRETINEPPFLALK